MPTLCSATAMAQPPAPVSQLRWPTICSAGAAEWRSTIPTKGVELVRRYSNPESGLHSLQLEINRKLYMDEQSLTLRAGSDRLKHDLQDLARELLRLRLSDLA